MDSGDRVELVHTTDPYTNLEPGDRGTVVDVTTDTFGDSPVRKVHVDWDSGSTLSMIRGEDRIEVVDDDA